MSFIILVLIIILLYALLTKYSSMHKVLFMILLVSGMTFSFLVFGLSMFSRNSIISILDTEMDMMVFIHVCIVWFAADALVIYRILKQYHKYLDVNSELITKSGQGPE